MKTKVGMAEEGNQLKASLHYAVAKICEAEASNKQIECSKAFIACLTETVFEKMEIFAIDLEAFSRHCKRTVVNMEDVKLLTRHNADLKEKTEECCSLLEIKKTKTKKKKSDCSDIT